MLFIIALTSVFFGCGGGQGHFAGERVFVGLHGSPTDHFYQVNFVSGVEYWFPVFQGFKQAGNLLGVSTFYMGAIEYDASRQVDVFNQVLARNPRGIFVAPITAEAFVEPIQRAIAQGVAVVTFAPDSPDSGRHAYITSDNVQEGQTAARLIGQALGGQGKAMTLRNPGATNHDIRIDTFIATIRAEFPGIELVADIPTNQDPTVAYNAVMTVAQMHPDLGAVWMPEASSAIGAAQAAIELGGGTAEILIVHADVNEQVLDMIIRGDIYAAINPDQGMQGFFGMLMLFMAANPDLIEPMNGRRAQGLNPVNIPFVDNGLTIVTRENAQFFFLDEYARYLGYANVAAMMQPGRGIPTHVRGMVTSQR
jgi:ribose transport system substrate-binding protein